MKKKFLLFPIVLLATSLMFQGCSKSAAEGGESAPEEAASELSIVSVQAGQPEVSIMLPGDLIPWQETEIFAKVDGFVKEVLVDRGDRVKKGQLLAKLEAPEMMAKVRREEAHVNELKAKRKASKSVYNRIFQASKTKGAVSENELDQSYAIMIEDSANLETAKASLRAMEELIVYLYLRAPYDGIITLRAVSPGALVGPAEPQPLFKMEDNHKLRLTVAIPEEYVSELHLGSKVEFKVSALPDHVFKAVMAREADKMQTDLRAMLTEFDAPNPKGYLKGGMFADVEVKLKRDHATLYVPSTSVLNSTLGVYVEKVENDTVQWVPVKTGNIDGERIEIFGDIEPGDQVVEKASEEIREGFRIMKEQEDHQVEKDLKEESKG